MRIELDTMYGEMSRASFSGLVLNFDSSPMRAYGLDRIAGRQEVSVKTTRVVSANGAITTFAPAQVLLVTCSMICAKYLLLLF